MRQQVQQAVSSTEEAPLNSVASASTTAANNDSERDTQNEVLLEGATNRAVTTDAEQAIAAALTPTDFTPSEALTVADVGDRALVWGRYAQTALSTEPVPIDFALASEGRQVTVGNLQYGLFRTEAGSKRVDAGLGLVGFQLNSAQAVYNSSSGVVAMEVGGGTLDLDFQRNVFSTTLDLNHELTGQIDFVAHGQVVDGGFLRAIEATQRVAGAVSLDGSEAGYLFERQLENGEISGLTLWDSQQ